MFKRWTADMLISEELMKEIIQAHINSSCYNDFKSIVTSVRQSVRGGFSVKLESKNKTAPTETPPIKEG